MKKLSLKSKRKIREENQNYRINSLERQIQKLENQARMNEWRAKQNERFEEKEAMNKVYHDVQKATKWNEADKYSLRYDPDKHITAVYVNDKQLYGVSEVHISLDGDMQEPRIELVGYGSLDVTTGTVKDFGRPHDED